MCFYYGWVEGDIWDNEWNGNTYKWKKKIKKFSSSTTILFGHGETSHTHFNMFRDLHILNLRIVAPTSNLIPLENNNL